MLNDEQYMERTPDLIAKIRAMREAAEKKMNRFTRVDDYDARRVIGHGSKAAPVSDETVSPSPVVERPKKTATKSSSPQATIEFKPAPAESGDHGAEE